MRGIEGALLVLEEVEKGAFAAESLRKLWSEIEPTERKLTATLVYITLRRQGLWKHLLGKYCKRPLETLNRQTMSVLIVGIAGVLDLKHFKPGVLVNALVQNVKHIKDEDGVAREAALVNAVLHTVIDKAPHYIETLKKAPALRDQALAHGVPGWGAAEWNRDWGMKEAKRLLPLSSMQTYLSVRVSPGVDRKEWADGYVLSPARPSDLSEYAIQIESNPYPPDLPGYRSGDVTPQSESSIWAVESLLSYWKGGNLLDMCMGRGVKAGHILSYCQDASVEGWDISQARLGAAKREFARLGVGERVMIKAGDALQLSPDPPPSAILLDAPCSGSGTWGRHPEGKWHMSPDKLWKASALQGQLFGRAADILAPGGIIMYCTCSIFREENEKVIGDVLVSRQDLVELPMKNKNPLQRKGKPYGAVVLPETPWMDGFYAAMFRKKN